ncbi:MAG: DUF1425 domain-containing protein [Burkholderiales bacterium]|jgi:uncharacterized protein YcfL
MSKLIMDRSSSRIFGFFKCMALLLTPIMVVGCASSPICKNELVTLINDADVRVTGSACRVENGYLRVDIDVQSKYRKERSLAYRFDWFDKEGALVGREEAWKPIYFYKRETKTIRAVAPVKEAVDFRFLFKE